MKLKQSKYGILINVLSGGILFPLILVVVYALIYILKSYTLNISLNNNIIFDIKHIDLTTMIISLVCSIILMVLLIEVYLRNEPQILRFEDNLLECRTLLTKKKVLLSSCRVFETKSFFSVKTYCIQMEMNNDRQYLKLENFRFKDIESFITKIRN